jgi:hypothetical protein
MSRSHLLLISCGFLVLPSRAETITWFCDPVSSNLDATGQPMDGFFQFQLGAFTAGFEPTATNAAQWAANWTPAATADYHEGNRLFQGQFTLTSNAAPFTVNGKGWLWGFRNSGSGSDWILFRHPAWRWPAANPLNPPLRQWNTKDATEVILGSVSSAGSPFLMKTAAVSTYEQWQSSELEGHPLAAADDDADQDGVANFLEYVFGTSPIDAGSALHPPVSMVEISGQRHLQMTVPRVPGRLFSGRVEVSGNLSDWQSGAPFTTVVSEGANALVIRDAAPVGPAHPKRFIRFKATEP